MWSSAFAERPGWWPASHQNIVGVIDRGDHDGRPFIVFEFIDGESLKQLVARTGPLPVDRALELAIQVARGLAFAHEKGFVHRDVKPQNVLLNGNGEAKVTDFGIARSLDVQQGVTQTGTVLGTSDYIAPEQAQGQQVDEHTDIYSLGIVLYELLTGELPFSGDNFVAVAMQHINDQAPPVSLSRPEVSPRLDAAVARALAKDPGDRFETMAAFRAELETCLEESRVDADGAPTGVMPTVRKPRPERGRRSRPRRPIPARFLIAAAVVIAGAVLAWALTRGGSNARRVAAAARRSLSRASRPTTPTAITTNIPSSSSTPPMAATRRSGRRSATRMRTAVSTSRASVSCSMPARR